MEGKSHYPGRPYRLSVAFEEGVWRAYGMDDEGQERHLGHIVHEGGSGYHAESACATYRCTFGSIDIAIDTLYQKCMKSGYLQKGHANYLKEVAW